MNTFNKQNLLKNTHYNEVLLENYPNQFFSLKNEEKSNRAFLSFCGR